MAFVNEIVGKLGGRRGHRPAAPAVAECGGGVNKVAQVSINTILGYMHPLNHIPVEILTTHSTDQMCRALTPI